MVVDHDAGGTDGGNFGGGRGPDFLGKSLASVHDLANVG
jgi:hypothetical protein